MADQPENLVLELLRAIRSEAAANKKELKSDIADVNSEINSLRADVPSDLLTAQRDTRDQIVGLRRAVVEYHSSVVGHGLIISDLEARVRRMELRLNMDEMGAH